MRFISHRGNLYGPDLEREKHPDYITEALNLGYDVEIDVWLLNGVYWLGHDEPQYKTNLEFLKNDGNQTGMVESSGSFTKARKRLQKYEEQIEKLLIDIENGVPGAREKLKTKEGELDVFLSKGEGFVFKNFVELIESKDTGLRSIKEITELTQNLKVSL